MSGVLTAASVLSPLVQGDGALAQWRAEREANVDRVSMDEYEAVNLYTSNASRELSPWDLSHLESFCQKGSATGQRDLYRGIPGDTDSIIANLTPGSIIEGGFVSTSACPGVAKKFAETSSGNGAIIRILTDQGAALGDWIAVKGDEEREVLLGPNVNLQVVSVQIEQYVAGWAEQTVTVIDCVIA